MSKSIKQIADEIGVSKQAVFKKIKREPLSTSLKQFISTVDGRLMVSVDGEKIIKQAFYSADTANTDEVCEQTEQTLKNEVNDNQLTVHTKVHDNQFAVDGAVNDNQSSTINQTNDYKTSQDIENIITVLENTIETLKNQLEIKDAQLEKLTDALVAAQQTAAAAQALHAGTIQQQITTTQDTQEKKSWLKKLFG